MRGSRHTQEQIIPFPVVLSIAEVDRFAEQACASFDSKTGRPGLPPGIYFRLLLAGYFEGIDSERGIPWRAADSLALRSFRTYP